MRKLAVPIYESAFPAYSASCCKSFPGDVARFEFEPKGDVIDKFVLKKERFQKPCCLEQQFYVRKIVID